MEWIRRVLPLSGGIFYHYLALRFSRTLWQPFRTDVARWLSSWNPASEELIIFGSSAGYSLSEPFLNRFKRIIAVEPDPIARVLFRRRFANAKIEFENDRDLLSPIAKDYEGSSSKLAIEKLAAFLKRHPNAAVLFSNVLGQLPLEFPHLSDAIFAKHLVAIRGALRGREWASYHDLLSTWSKPNSLAPFTLPAGPMDLTEFSKKHLADVRRSSRLEVTDHQTHSLSAGEETQCSWWELAPGRFHLIGFLSSAKPN